LSDVIEGGDEEFSVSLDLLRADDVVVLNMDFTLLDSAVNGGEPGSVGVSLSVVGYGALALGGYTPYAYTADVFTDDVEEMETRIQQLDVAELLGTLASKR
jgi:hypothetical protein